MNIFSLLKQLIIWESNITSYLPFIAALINYQPFLGCSPSTIVLMLISEITDNNFCQKNWLL
jgi:hypothetical protein